MSTLRSRAQMFLVNSFTQAIRATQKNRSILKFIDELESESAAKDIIDRLTQETLVFSTPTELRGFAMRSEFLNFGLPGSMVLDLGVAEGHSSLLIANQMLGSSALVCSFDAFEGIRDPWSKIDRPPGSMDLHGLVPQELLNHPNIYVVKGWVEDTLEGFLEQRSEDYVSFVHLDMDVYPPTRFALEKLLPFLRNGTHLLFDDMYGFPGWRNHSYKAMAEVLGDLRLVPLAFSRKQAFYRVADAGLPDMPKPQDMG